MWRCILKITFEIPEIFVTFSCICFLKASYWMGGTMLAAGLLMSLFRYGLAIQKQKEEEARKIELIREVSEGFVGVLSNFSSGTSSKFH